MNTIIEAQVHAVNDFEIGSNQDGQVDDQDANFADLRLWKDLNQDGISQSNELFTLSELNIAAISVAKTENNQLLPNGNVLADSGTFTYTDGSTGGMGTTGALGDVDLREDTFYSHFTDPVPLTPEAQSLPNMHGSGQVRDLREAASLSTDLTAILTGYSQATTRAAQYSQLDAVIKAWSDTSPMLTTATGAYAGHPLSVSFDGVAAGSAEHNAWLDKLSIIERFNGRTFRQIPAGTDPVGIGFSRAQMDFLNQSYAAIRQSVYDGLLLQTRVKPWLDSISITLDVDGAVALDFSDMEAAIAARAGTDAAQTTIDMVEMLKITGRTLPDSGWDGWGFLGDTLRSVPITDTLQSVLSEYNIRFTDSAPLYLTGTANADILIGDANANVLRGGDGNDEIYASRGNDVIEGGSGNDILDGGEGDDTVTDTGGNNTLVGGAGNDHITVSGSGNNTIDGGTGDDTLIVSSGSDTYLFGRGDGQDVIFDSGGSDTVRFGAGITNADLTAFKQGDDLVVRIADPADPVATDQFTARNWFLGGQYRIETFQFADGTSLSGNMLTSSATVVADPSTINGGTGNDTIYGTSENDVITDTGGTNVIDAGGGDDTFRTTGGGSDTYIFNRGDGQDAIFDGGGTDTIRFGVGIIITDLAYSKDGDDLVIRINDPANPAASDNLTVNDWFMDSVYRIETFAFSDGTSIPGYQLLQQIAAPLNGTAGDDIIDGWYHNNIIYGFGGHDIIIGAGGNDVIDAGDGNDVVITGDGNDTITGLGGDDTLTGGGGHDTIDAGDGNDVISTGSGNDTVYGGAGNDTVTDAGGTNAIYGEDGDDVITTPHGTGGVIDGGAGNDTVFTNYASSSTLRGGAGDDSLRISQANVSEGYSAARAGATNRFEGGTGNDVLQGSAGADTYVFDRGDGQDTIADNPSGYDGALRGPGWEAPWPMGSDTVRFGAGITSADLTPFKQGDNLVVRINDPANPAATDQLTIERWFLGWQYRIESFAFADGTSVTGDALDQIARILTGTDGNDVINGWGDNNTITGLGGDDTLTGGGGHDTIDAGDGNDVISTGSGNDTVYGGAGNDTVTDAGGTNAIYGEDGDDVITTPHGTGGVIDGGAGNDTVFTNYASSSTLRGGAGDDSLRISQANVSEGYSAARAGATNRFEGGTGNDVLQGSAGADTYVFDRGDGQDTIADNPSGYDGALRGPGWEAPWPMGSDTVRFGAGITSADLTPFKQGDNLVVRINDPANPAATDQLTIERWFLGWQYRIESFAFADGSTMGIADIEALIPKATAGNDTLTLGLGNDDVNALGGNDVVDTGAGNDIITGGTGDDTLSGGAGSDIYIFNLGDGVDIINDLALASEGNALQFGTGIDPTALTLSYDGGVLVLNLGGGDQLRLTNFSSTDVYGAHAVETFSFADGTVLTYSQLIDRGFDLVGTAGDDVITGTNGMDRIVGGDGNDTLYGGAGNDTYIFDAGNGTDTIYDNASETNTLVFGSGVDPNSVTLNLGSLFINIGNGEGVHLEDFNPNDVFGSGIIQHFVFADGTTLNLASLLALGFDINGTDGDDVLTGTSVTDRITGGLGNDVLSGGAGDDTYSYVLGDGSDTVRDSAGNDILDITGIALADLNTTINGNDLVLELSDGNTITVQDWLLGADNQLETVILDGISFTGNFIETWGHAPILVSPVPDTSTDEDSSLNLDISTYFTDADLSRGDALTYSATVGGGDLPAWLAFDAIAGSFTGIPLQADVGSLGIEITATDSVGRSASETFTLTINNVNDIPIVANSVVDQSTDEDSLFNFILSAETFSDEDSVLGDTLTLSAALADGSILPDWLSFDAATGAFTGTPDNSFVGNYTLTVTATDSDGQSVSDTFMFTVNNTNDVPIVVEVIGDQVTDEDAPFVFALPAGVFADDDIIHGDSLTISAALADGSALPDWLTFDALTGTFTGIPDNEQVGSYDIRITATDVAGTSASDVFTLTINNVNDIPVIAAPIADVATDEDQPFSLSVADAFTDDDLIHGDSLTLAARLADGTVLPDWLAFDAATGTFSGTPDNGQVGSYDIQITATDLAGISASDVYTLTVNNINDNPILANALNNLATDEDAPFSFILPSNTFFDDDLIHGDSLTLSATLADGSVLPDWLGFDAATGTFTGTPDNWDVGNYEIRVIATDLAGTSVFDDFVLTVNNVNDAPILANPLADQTATEGTAFNYILAGNTFHDDDTIHGDTLTYEAALADGSDLPSWLSFDTVTQTFLGQASADSTLIGTDGDDVLVDTDTGISGMWDIKVTATDTAGVSAEDAYTLTLQGVAGNDTLTGGKGNDILNGGGGNDTYLYNLGDGLDTLTDSSGTDTVSLGTGFSFDNSVIRVDSTTGIAHLRFLDTDGCETEEGMDIALNPDGSSPIEAFTFQDGTTYSLNDLALQQITWYGDKKANTIVTGRHDDTIYAGKGGDTVYSGTGNDILYGEKGNDKLYGEGGNDALYGGNGDDTLDGGAGNDLLDGGKGHNTLIGGKGNDTLILGEGENTIRFNLGDGHDTLIQQGKEHEDNDIKFGAGITQQHLWFSRNGNDLTINILGTDDGMTIEGWYNADPHSDDCDDDDHNKDRTIEEFQTSNGYELEDKQVALLVQAMASFTPIPGSGTPLPTEMPDQLQATLAAAWERDC